MKTSSHASSPMNLDTRSDLSEGYLTNNLNKL